MTQEDGLKALNRIIFNVTGKTVSLTPEMDLKQSDILDSVDALVFFMELENTLEAEGYYSVKKLLSLIDRN